MRAATIVEPGRVEVLDFEIPVAKHDGDLVVRMHRASICGSDLHSAFHGFHNETRLGLPGYPGHEGVGVVVESRSSRFNVGDEVLTVPIGVTGGCFAEYQLIDDLHVVRLPEGGDIERLLMAQQYGATLYSMRLFWPELGNWGTAGTAAIIGAGSAGLFFLQQAKLLGFEHIVISDLNKDRLKVAASLGAQTVVHAPDESFVDAVKDVTNGVGADLVIEAAGFDSARADSIAAVRYLGTVGFFGFPERYGLAPFPIFDAFRKVVRVQLANGTQAEPGLVAFRDALQHIHDGTIDVEYCLGATYDIEGVPEAMALADRQADGLIKLSIDLTK